MSKKRCSAVWPLLPSVMTVFGCAVVSAACTRHAPPSPAVAAALPHRTPACMEDCVEYGECSLLGDDCIVTRDEDCARSELCLKHGRCTAFDGSCEAMTDRDCALSKACNDKGYCFAHPEKHRCDDGKERNSTGLMAAGIAVTGAGGGAVLAGVVLLALNGLGGALSSLGGGSGASDDLTTLSVGLMIGGVVFGAGVGVPMLVTGAQRSPRTESSSVVPELTVSPGHAAATWSF